MAIGVRVEPELEQQLDQLAQRLGRSHSSCVREAIVQVVQRFGKTTKPCVNQLSLPHAQGKEWSEPCPDWSIGRHDRDYLTPRADRYPLFSTWHKRGKSQPQLLQPAE